MIRPFVATRRCGGLARLLATARRFGEFVCLLGTGHCLRVQQVGFGRLVGHSRFTGDGG
jgi:hypothetical protein